MRYRLKLSSFVSLVGGLIFYLLMSCVVAQQRHSSSHLVCLASWNTECQVSCWSMAHLFSASVLTKLHDTMAPVDVVVYRVLDATKAKAAIQDRSAVLFVALPEPWILVQLGENLIECRHLHLPRQVIELILYLLIGQLFIPLLICL